MRVLRSSARRHPSRWIRCGVPTPPARFPHPRSLLRPGSLFGRRPSGASIAAGTAATNATPSATGSGGRLFRQGVLESGDAACLGHATRLGCASGLRRTNSAQLRYDLQDGARDTGLGLLYGDGVQILDPGGGGQGTGVDIPHLRQGSVGVFFPHEGTQAQPIADAAVFVASNSINIGLRAAGEVLGRQFQRRARCTQVDHERAWTAQRSGFRQGCTQIIKAQFSRVHRQWRFCRHRYRCIPRVFGRSDSICQGRGRKP
jgi:hypothetical protein